MSAKNKERDAAKARGDLFYFTGIPCPKGHVSKRYTSVYKCLACAEDEMAVLRSATKVRRAAAPLSPRQKAKQDGATRYNTGKLCPRGHWSDRETANGVCLACSKIDRDLRAIKNPEIRLKRRAWQKKEAERYKAHARNRRAKFKGLLGSHTKEDVDELWDSQNGLCVYCKKNLGKSFHVDHIKAVAKGGSNSKENIQLTCKTCNLRKHVKDHNEFVKILALENQ